MSNDIINREFREFGERMYIILICLILNIVVSWLVIPGIVMFIYSLLVLGNIKRINEQLNNLNLHKFRSLFISSITVIIFTGIILVIVAIPFVIGLVAYIMSIDFTSLTEEQILALLPDILVQVGPLIIIGIVGLSIFFVAFILQMKAWDNLNTFFRQNTGLFPDPIAYDAIEGSKNLKTASLCMILFFLIITPLIGLIYEILGYMKLSRLKNLGYSSPKPSIQPQPLPAAQTTQKDDVRYCPECGTKVKAAENFCNSCGSKL